VKKISGAKVRFTLLSAFLVWMAVGCESQPDAKFHCDGFSIVPYEKMTEGDQSKWRRFWGGCGIEIDPKYPVGSEPPYVPWFKEKPPEKPPELPPPPETPPPPPELPPPKKQPPPPPPEEPLLEEDFYDQDVEDSQEEFPEEEEKEEAPIPQ